MISGRNHAVFAGAMCKKEPRRTFIRFPAGMELCEEDIQKLVTVGDVVRYISGIIE